MSLQRVYKAMFVLEKIHHRKILSWNHKVQCWCLSGWGGEASPSSGLTGSWVRKAAGIPSPCLPLLSLGCAVCCSLQPCNLLLQVGFFWVFFFTKMSLNVINPLQPAAVVLSRRKSPSGLRGDARVGSVWALLRGAEIKPGLEMSSSCGKAVSSRLEVKKPGMSLSLCWACTTLNLSHVLSLTCAKSIKIMPFLFLNETARI